MKATLKIIALAMALTAAAAPLAAVAAEANVAEAVAKDSARVRVQPGGLLIEVTGEASCHIVIYALTGQVVKQLDAAPGSTAIDLPTGYYIVRYGHSTVKVAVK